MLCLHCILFHISPSASEKVPAFCCRSFSTWSGPSLQWGWPWSPRAWHTHGKLPLSKMTDVCIHLFNKNLLITYSVPEIMMGIADTKVNQIRFLSPVSLQLRKCKNDLGLISSTFRYKWLRIYFKCPLSILRHNFSSVLIVWVFRLAYCLHCKGHSGHFARIIEDSTFLESTCPNELFSAHKILKDCYILIEC